MLMILLEGGYESDVDIGYESFQLLTSHTNRFSSSLLSCALGGGATVRSGGALPALWLRRALQGSDLRAKHGKRTRSLMVFASFFKFNTMIYCSYGQISMCGIKEVSCKCSFIEYGRFF